MESFEDIQSKRLIRIKHLFNVDKESLKNSFVVFYADTNTTFLVNGSGWNEEQRIEYIKRLINEIQTGTNYSREIIAQSGNIYFVY